MSVHPHYGALQSARGLAALVVVAHHCLFALNTTGMVHDVAAISANAAHAAVVFFFVLSGFVLSLSLDSKPLTVRSVADFYIRRAWRIYPALWFACAIGLTYASLLHRALTDPDVSTWFAARFRPEDLTPADIVASLAAVRPVLVPPGWSIFVELVGSALLPFLSFARRGPVWAFLLLVLILGGQGFVHSGYWNIGLYIVDFAMGASLVSLSPFIRRALRGWGSRAPLLAISVAYMLLVRSEGALLHLFLSVSAVAMVAVIVSRERWTWMENKTLVHLGDISYSVYVLHFPIMGICLYAIDGAATAHWEALILCVVTISLVLALSELSYRWIELPGIRMGRAFSRGLRMRGAD